MEVIRIEHLPAPPRSRPGHARRAHRKSESLRSGSADLLLLGEAIIIGAEQSADVCEASFFAEKVQPSASENIFCAISSASQSPKPGRAGG